ncbi:hypothetical protein ACFOD4_00925 [Pseudoroseomonas globiformis]|uniref:Glycoside hydrolase family 5 domain-containing protein n=1 Tax=Teichococcus globiformis TaxID=2307229 RepID=A0ABV7FXQ8_9PROT
MRASGHIASGLILGLFVAALSSAGAEAGERLRGWIGNTGVTAGLGVNVHFPPGRPHDFERISKLGFRIIRTDLLWASVERQQGAYDWGRIDRLLSAMEAHGLKPLLILAYSNPLYAAREAGRSSSPSLAFAAPQHGEPRIAFMRFVAAAAQRYRGKVAWEIWNEPDHNFGNPVNLHSFIDFAGEACRTLRHHDPDAVVMGPAASGFLWWFLDDFVRADAGACFDAVSVHPYRDRSPEDVLEDWGRLHGSLRRITEGQGRTLPERVNSEWGFSSMGGEWSRERQAAYVSRLWLLDRMAGVPMSIIYDWWDDGPDPAEKEASFGIVDHHGRPKPLHAALSNLIGALEGFSYLGRIQVSQPQAYLLLFRQVDGMTQRIVAWHTGGATEDIALPVIPCSASDDGSGCGPLPAGIRLRLDAAPQVFQVTAQGLRHLEGVP